MSRHIYTCVIPVYLTAAVDDIPTAGFFYVGRFTSARQKCTWYIPGTGMNEYVWYSYVPVQRTSTAAEGGSALRLFRTYKYVRD